MNDKSLSFNTLKDIYAALNKLPGPEGCEFLEIEPGVFAYVESESIFWEEVQLNLFKKEDKSE